MAFVKKDEVTLEPLTKDNIKEMARIQYEIFNDSKSVGYLDYLKELKKKSTSVLPQDYLIKFYGHSVGIIGIYQYKKYKKDVWLNWFGVLPEFRKRGIGTLALLEIIRIAKNLGYENLRLFSYRSHGKAHGIYRKNLEIEEEYLNELDKETLSKQGECKIFSFSLDGKKVEPWNSKYIDLAGDLKLHYDSVDKLKKDGIIETQETIEFEELNEDNLARGGVIQNKIFPEENGSEDLRESVYKEIPSHQFMINYYLPKIDNRYVGITGLYAYKNYPSDAWLAWFGILENERRKGYATKILKQTMDRARELGFETLRLYTDKEDNQNAIKLYEKFGMTSEVYDNPDDPHFEFSNTLIYSISLTNSKLELWNNKNLDLGGHDKRNS